MSEPAEALLGLLPTLLELSGVGMPSGLALQGHSLAPLLLRGASPLDRPCPVRASSARSLALTLARTLALTLALTPALTPALTLALIQALALILTPTRCAPPRCAASPCLPGSPAETSCGAPHTPLALGHPNPNLNPNPNPNSNPNPDRKP